MSRVNILKRAKIGARWKLLSIPRNDKGIPNWAALPEGRYFIEWYLGGKRRREFGGTTVAQALESQKRKRHELEGRHLGLPGFEKAGEQVKNPPLHVAVSHYLDQVETLKKPNTLRKYKAVLERFTEYFINRSTVRDISAEDLSRFIVDLMKNQHMAANTVIHNVIIIAQFFKRQGRPNITRELHLPGRITTLPCEYREEELSRFFAACKMGESVLFSTFLMTGLREQEVVHLIWTDINFELRVVRVTAKPWRSIPNDGRSTRCRSPFNWRNCCEPIRGVPTASSFFLLARETGSSTCWIGARLLLPGRNLTLRGSI